MFVMCMYVVVFRAYAHDDVDDGGDGVGADGPDDVDVAEGKSPI